MPLSLWLCAPHAPTSRASTCTTCCWSAEQCNTPLATRSLGSPATRAGWPTESFGCLEAQRSQAPAACARRAPTAVAHRSRGVSAPPCVRASSATGTLVHEHPSLGAPLDLELPSANGRVYEASPGRTALCTSASVPRARVVGKSTTFRITRASPLSPTHHRKCSPTRRRPPCSRVPTNAPLLGSASSWLGGCGLRRTATRRGGAMCNEQSSLAYCVLARRQEGAGGRAPCHGRGTLQYTGLVLIFTRSLQ